MYPSMHWGRHPLADTPRQTPPPPGRHTATAADGTHPTEMHSCLPIYFSTLFDPKKFLRNIYRMQTTLFRFSRSDQLFHKVNQTELHDVPQNFVNFHSQDFQPQSIFFSEICPKMMASKKHKRKELRLDRPSICLMYHIQYTHI